MDKHYFFLFIFLFFLFSCNQQEKSLEPTPQYPIYSGTAKGLRNGESWHAYVIAANQNGKVLLTISKSNKDSVLQEGLVFGNIPKHPFKDTIQLIERDTPYVILNTGIYSLYNLNDDWDLVTPNLEMILSKEHWFEVTEYEDATKTIKGKFEVSYFNPFLNMDKDSIISFENVTFTAKVVE